MSESTPPPPTGGGAKYAILGLVAILAAVGMYCGMQEEEETAPVVENTTPEAPVVPRSTGFEPEIEIPDEDEEDAGPEDTGPEDTGETVMMSTMRRAPRECTGNLDVAAVRQVIGRQRQQVRSCYERRLKQNNILQGTVNVRLVVGNDGSVDQVAVGGSLRDNEVFGCVRRLARGWRFPRPTGGACAQINAPFNLTPRP